MTITKKIDICYDYVKNAENTASNGDFVNSNRYWIKANDLAVELLENNNPGAFSDEEYSFLEKISNHFKD